MKPNSSFFIFGSGGHAKVLWDLVLGKGDTFQGYCSPTNGFDEQAGKLIYYKDDNEAFKNLNSSYVSLVNGIGQLPGNLIRKNLFVKAKSYGFNFPVLIHRHSFVSDNAILSEGVQVMAGGIIQSGSHIGKNSIINTRTGIDHDVSIGSHCHICPGVTICGNVKIGDNVFIGSGATIIQSISICDNSIIGAGEIIRKNIESLSV